MALYYVGELVRSKDVTRDEGNQQLHPPAPCVLLVSGLKSTPCLGFCRILGPLWSNGSFRAIAVNSSFTLVDVFAEVSKKSSPASRAYASASAVSMARLSGLSATMSDLLPAKAMTIFSFACLCSSLTHDFALSNDDCGKRQHLSRPARRETAHRLGNIVYDDGAICISVVHWRKRFVPLLTSSVPYFKLHRRIFIK